MKKLLCGLLVAASTQAATPLFRASFDQTNWTAVRGAAAPDPSMQHAGAKSLRVEPGASTDACVRLAPVPLRIGKRYELDAWVRTDGVEVHDTDRSPIASGAALTMASMPFDVRSAALSGTRPWTRLTLRFVATRAEDSIEFTVGNGGSFKGKAWFAGASLDEISSDGEWPAREAVATFGPAYRYPDAGWTYLHIEGKPYDRGYQHGHLMAREIPEYLERCAADLGHKSDARGWEQLRTTANALFLRGFDREILEEMQGIADGASDAGAKWLGRRIDLVDIVVANVTVEMDELQAAMPVTPTGLEGLHFEAPPYFDRKRDLKEHCSAFAATGSATRDGKMVIGHVTWWPLTLAEQTNVMLDIKPAAGHRLLMQSYAGGIESGTDWYQNDAGVVLTETTIRQTPFNFQGTPVAFRARLAIQYGDDVDKVVEQLGTKNNGLYTNEWLIGDAKNNEIAMYELGTYHTKLWRSTKNEWFGETPGFYWGCNNEKDLNVRLEYFPDPKGQPEYIPYVPGVRDLAWQDLYRKYHGQIDEQFGFLAFRTAPLVSASTMDAKIATAGMASNLMVWAAIGKPNQREWVPAQWEKENYAKNDGMYPSGYHLFPAEPSESLRAPIQENEKARLATPTAPEKLATSAEEKHVSYADRLWKGWILPASDSDIWLAAGSAAYQRVLASKELDKAISAQRAKYRGLKLAADDATNRFRIEETKGVLFLDAVRRRLGDDRFFTLMNEYFAANTTKTVSAQSFLDKAGVPFEAPAPGEGPAYLVTDIVRRLPSAILVYGTVRDAGANRYSAEQMQKQFLDLHESAVPIRKDFEVSEEDLRGRDVIFIGRPETNSALAPWAERIGLVYPGSSFRFDEKAHASERQALLYSASNPVDAARMVLVVAGNDALHTVKLALGNSAWSPAEYIVFEDGKTPHAGFVKTAN
jgi:hypothetical protein